METGTPFTDLVREAQTGKTLRALAELAVDPVTKRAVAHSTLWRIAQGQSIKIEPAVVRAVAEAVGKPLREVQLAAAQQFIGLMAGDPLGASTAEAAVVVAHVPGMTASDMPRVQRLLSQWAAGDDDSRVPGEERPRG
ncbi:hypothetical protein CTZ27_26230 [Streptomyces griseocarneus]|nr:hypothetical protein CTZ27_26230 [Streptomyces griseocarneus]